MNPLKQEIAAMIAAEGPISIERFMTLALQHPRYGYYRTKLPIGAAGDFITAPEIHQMFGELIGLWAVEVWHQMGEPAPFRLIELGPGRGTLMADMVRAARLRPAFLEAADIRLVETSEALVDVQRATLSGVPVTWHASIADLPDGPVIILANEFFDALPIRQYVRTDAGLCERVVGLDGDGGLRLGLVLTGVPTEASALQGAVLEVSAAAQAMIRALASRIAATSGALLAIDYGYARPGGTDTLQALRHHRPDDPLRAPGEADLTALVDFAALARAAAGEGAAIYGPLGQGKFLSRLGLFERAAMLKRKATPEQAAAIETALTRLARPGPPNGPGASMADLFKVLAVVSPDLPVPPGFDPMTGQDR